MRQDIPSAPPEAEVIRLARKATGMTAEDAAAASKAHDPSGRGVGSTYWLDVERGRGGRRGEQVPIRASDRALAAMARAVGVEPRQLTEAGREDAARVLEEVLRRERRLATTQTPPAPLPLGAEEFARAHGVDPGNPLDPFIRAVNDEIERAEETYGGDVTGIQVFRGGPAAEIEAMVYDAPGVSREAKVVAIATLRASRAGRESVNPGRRSSAGLTLTLAGR